MAVYRLCLIVTLFFFVMSILMVNVKTSNDPRAGLQNGFWGIKYLIIIGSMIAAFWIPDTGSFGTVWMWFGLIGGFLFILIQLVLIIDFAHSWAEAWYGNYQVNVNTNRSLHNRARNEPSTKFSQSRRRPLLGVAKILLQEYENVAECSVTTLLHGQ